MRLDPRTLLAKLAGLPQATPGVVVPNPMSPVGPQPAPAIFQKPKAVMPTMPRVKPKAKARKVDKLTKGDKRDILGKLRAAAKKHGGKR